MSCIVFLARDSQLTVAKRFVVSVINMISRVRCPVGVKETILFGSERSEFESHPLRERNSKTHEMITISLKNQFFKNIIFTRIEAFRNFSRKCFSDLWKFYNVWFKNMVNQVPPGEPQGFTFNFWQCGVFHKFFSDTRGFSLLSSSRVGTFHQLIAPGVGISPKSWKKSENPRGGPGLPYIWITHKVRKNKNQAKNPIFESAIFWRIGRLRDFGKKTSYTHIAVSDLDPFKNSPKIFDKNFFPCFLSRKIEIPSQFGLKNVP